MGGKCVRVRWLEEPESEQESKSVAKLMLWFMCNRTATYWSATRKDIVCPCVCVAVCTSREVKRDFLVWLSYWWCEDNDGDTIRCWRHATNVRCSMFTILLMTAMMSVDAFIRVHISTCCSNRVSVAIPCAHVAAHGLETHDGKYNAHPKVSQGFPPR